MMHYTTVQALGQARVAELHHQAQRDALARAARRARRRNSTHLAARLVAALTRRSHRAGEPVIAPRRRYLHAQAGRLGDGR